MIDDQGRILHAPGGSDLGKALSKSSSMGTKLKQLLAEDDVQIRGEYDLFGQESEVVVATVSDLDWKVLVAVPVDDFYSPLRKLQATIIIVTIIVVMIVLGLVIRLGRSIVEPITHLSNTIQTITLDNRLSNRVEIDSQDEIGELARNFNNMIENINHSNQALNEALQHAQAASQAKSDFLSQMSHELRMPMNAIIGFGQLLEYDELTNEQMENVREIIRAGQHLMDLINQLLDLSRIEAGKLELSIDTINVCDVIDECHKISSLSDDRMNLDIRYAPCDSVLVLADRIRLKQVIINLLTNAVKYNRQDGAIDIIVSRTEKDKVRIEVADTGIGISQEKLN